MKLGIILGTRPEIIKLSSIIKCCQKNKLEYFVIHTNQHYTEYMDKVFFKNLGLLPAKYNLNVGSGTHAEQTSKMLVSIEKILVKEKPDIVIFQGDTNTTLASVLVTSKLHVKSAHVEAGLRSYDRTMPEEVNRVIADHLSDYLFCPTENSKINAINEGIKEDKIFVTGNTIVDAILQYNKTANERSNILKKLNLVEENYILVTAHRPSNVDSKRNLKRLISLISYASSKLNMVSVYPIHPRTKKNCEKFNIPIPRNIKLIDPIDFIDFLKLESLSKLILTDSGGVQEEACILKVPCITLRSNTERPETIYAGSNIIVGLDKNKLQKALLIANKPRNWENPFGNGKSGELIINILTTVNKKIKNS